MKNSVCIIPARGGSKRILKKNVKEFFGKPIIAYSIDNAIKSDLFAEVVVSTDDEEIAEVARLYGASVPFMRSAETSNDTAPLADVIDEVLEKYAAQGQKFDYACCLLPTAPLLFPHDLQKGFELLVSQGFDSVRPIVKYSYPIQRALKLDHGQVSMLNSEFMFTRSQDLEPMYHDAGLFYWMRAAVGLRGTNRGGVVVSELLAQDIDTEEDWNLAEIKYKILHTNE